LWDSDFDLGPAGLAHELKEDGSKARPRLIKMGSQRTRVIMGEAQNYPDVPCEVQNVGPPQN